MSALAAPVNEVVNLLWRHDPAQLQSLQTRYADLGELLEPSLQMGGAAPEAYLERLARFTVDGLVTAEKICEEAKSAGRRRLDQAARLQLLAQVVAVVASGSVIALIQAEVPAMATKLSALLALTGSVAAVVSQHYGRGIAPDGLGVGKAFLGLVEMGPKARGVRGELEAWLETGATVVHTAKIEALVGAGNDLCYKISELVDQIPGR